MNLWFASGNAHKKNELSAILGKELKTPLDAGLSKNDFCPAETGSSFFENAMIKALELHRVLEELHPPGYSSGDLIIADDSGICVDALGGRPGIHSAVYTGYGNKIELDSDKKLSDSERNAIILNELGSNPLRTARFVCSMILLYSPNRYFAVQETMEGEIAASASDCTGGFGYDPIFFIPELKCTAAELSGTEKNRHSHRGKAGRVIAKFL